MKFNPGYGNAVRLLVTVISVAMVAYLIWAIVLGTPEAVWFRGTHLLFVMLLLILRVTGRNFMTFFSMLIRSTAGRDGSSPEAQHVISAP